MGRPTHSLRSTIIALTHQAFYSDDSLKIRNLIHLKIFDVSIDMRIFFCKTWICTGFILYCHILHCTIHCI